MRRGPKEMRAMVGATLAAAAYATAAFAAEALVPVAYPSEFDIHSSGTVEPVVYAEASGEFTNPTDRKGIEAICENSRRMGLATRMPVFEAGDDKPIATRTWDFANERHSAHYTVRHDYVCDRAGPPATSGDALCDCTYRVKPKYSAHIRNQIDGNVEVIDIDMSRRSARRRLAPGKLSLELDRGEALVKRLAPEVVGRDLVAGIPCVVRRQSLGGANHLDLCVSEDPDRLLPPALRFRTLSEVQPSPSGTGAYRWMKTEKVVIHALADSAVFAIPSGLDVKDMK